MRALLAGMSKLIYTASRRVLLSLSGIGLAAACSPQIHSGDGSVGNSGLAAAVATEAQDPSSPGPFAPGAASQATGSSRAAAPPRKAATVPPGSGRRAIQSEIFLARAKAPLPVLGRFHPGRLDVTGGCLTVTLSGSAGEATAVFPPGARIVYRDGEPAAVAYAVRSIPIGEDTRIPGGGSVSSANLATTLPAGCPRELFPIGG